MIAIYARVSTDEQAIHGVSLMTQVADCRKHIGPTTETITEFIDAGESGITLDRPQLIALRERIGQGAIQRLVILDPDRLSRKLVHQLLLTEEFERAGLSLEFVNFEWEQTPEGRLFYSLRGAVAEFEREKIRERTRRGWLAKAQQGQLVAGMQRFGYRYDPQTKTVAEDPETAPIVREIFRLAADEHLSTGKIAEVLARRHIPPPRGHVWWRDTISKMLRNPAYMGIAYVHQYESSNHNRRRDPDEWIAIEVPALVTPKQWNRARDVIYRYQKIWKGRQELPMLLRRLLYCGQCGHVLSTNVRTIKGQTYRYYFCSHRYSRHFDIQGPPKSVPTCTLPWIAAEPLEAAVWQDIVTILDDPDGWQSAQNAPEPLPTALDGAERITQELRRIHRSRQRLLSLVRKDLITEHDAERELATLKAEEQQLEQEQAQLQRKRPSIRAVAKDLRESLGPHLDALPFPTRREIMVRMIDQVIVTVDEAGHVTADLRFVGEPIDIPKK